MPWDYFSKEKVRDSIHEEMFNQYFESEGFKVIGYRDVPVDTRAIAQHVADTMPYIQQVFVDITGVKEVENDCFSKKAN